MPDVRVARSLESAGLAVDDDPLADSSASVVLVEAKETVAEMAVLLRQIQLVRTLPLPSAAIRHQA